MSTFCAVSDAELISTISRASRRVVYVARGITGAVAKALGDLLDRQHEVAMTRVLDPDEDVCRIGYGDRAGADARREAAAGDPQADIDAVALRKSLGAAVERLVKGRPSVKTRYKDVTYEHIYDKTIRELVRKALPADVQMKLGNWDVHFRAAKEQQPVSGNASESVNRGAVPVGADLESTHGDSQR